MTGTQREVGERIVDDIVGPAAVGGVVGFAGRALGYLDDFAAAVTAVIVAGAGFIWNKINPFDCPPTSPLVIDLDGDGIELTSLGDSNAFFDLNVDGFAERTGWVQSDDGLLALDINGNGEIDDNSELFGNATGFDNGFLQLAELDSNDDGVIDGNDTGFAELQIWRDFDQDGVSDSGELQALSDAGIASISLDAIEVEETNLDHLVTDRSTVTFTDGTNGIIEDVHFQNDTTLAYKLLPDEFEFHPTALALPLLWGFGQIASSWVSYSEDQVLRDEAVSLVNQLATGDVTGFLEDFEGFVLIWAGVADVPADSRGEHIDARKLAFLEKMHGTAFVDQYGGSNPRVNAGVELEMYFEETVKQLAGVFMAQSAVSKGFLDAYEADNLAAFQPSFEGNPLSVFTNLVNVTSGERTLSGDLSEVLAGLQNSIENGEITTANAIAAVMLLKTDFSSNEKEFHLLLQVAVVKAGLDPTTDFITALTFADDQQLLDGATGNDTITADSASYIRAGAGDDIVTGSAGQDLIYGGEGNDTLNGGGGADIYVYSLGDGSDTIKDYSTKSENDRLVFTDVNADDVTFSQNSGKDLIITLSNGDTITITDHFDNGWEDMELIEFADGTVLDLAGIAAKTISDQNGDGDDVVRGSTGADTFHGGVGNDTLIGGTGADTYIYSLGDGSDTIKDYSTRSEDDRLIFTDLNADDVTFSQNSGKDLIITLSNGDTITITDHFDNGWEDMELIEFADG
ncbi:BapA/Bap/LapF family prefix-like domain-containing protein, partial [Ruegeria arenilitoris]|uniref:BapA/Bap/LapF family prefix-like domain-containing protein n=1 Tax=Ruegeria arenilitoris TaxID=1173585 RepID=UPI002670A28B